MYVNPCLWSKSSHSHRYISILCYYACHRDIYVFYLWYVTYSFRSTNPELLYGHNGCITYFLRTTSVYSRYTYYMYFSIIISKQQLLYCGFSVWSPKKIHETKQFLLLLYNHTTKINFFISDIWCFAFPMLSRTFHRKLKRISEQIRDRRSWQIQPNKTEIIYNI